MRISLLIFIFISIGFAQPADSLVDSLFVKNAIVSDTEKILKPVKDQWFSQDKFLHFYFSASITGLTYHLYVCRLNKDEDAGKIYSVSITALLSLGKEIYDKKKKGHFSWKDLCWDGLGLAVGYFAFIHDY